MEAARTSSGSGTRHRRCRCCLPALTGFTTSRRGEADASHHGRARDGSQHDVKTGEKPAPRRAGTRSYHNEPGANSVRRQARVAVRDASILRPAMPCGVHRGPGQETRRGGRSGMRGRSAVGSNGAVRETRADVRVPRDCVGWTQAMHGVDSRAARLPTQLVRGGEHAAQPCDIPKSWTSREGNTNATQHGVGVR